MTYFLVDQSDPENIHIKTSAGEVTVTKDMLRHGVMVGDVRFSMADPESANHVAAEKARREAEFDEKTAAGMVGITDGYGDDPLVYSVVNRGDRVTWWVTTEAWNRYESARDAFREAEDALWSPVPVADDSATE